MNLSQTSYEHVLLNEQGVALLAGTDMKVIELVLGHLAHGWSAEELHFQHPYLGLGQIYSALAYYWDHKEALDSDITNRLNQVDLLQKSMGKSLLRSRLEGEGFL